MVTNDRSAPLVAGKPNSSSTGGVSINQLEREPKPGQSSACSFCRRYSFSCMCSVMNIYVPGSGPGIRSYTVGNAASLGGLFANGLPSKPSENKIRRANTSATTSPAPASPPQMPKPSVGEGIDTFHSCICK